MLKGASRIAQDLLGSERTALLKLEMILIPELGKQEEGGSANGKTKSKQSY